MSRIKVAETTLLNDLLLFQIIIFIFNSKMNISSSSQLRKSHGVNLIRTCFYGKVNDLRIVHPESLGWINYSEYNSNGDIIREKTIQFNGSTSNVKEYEYDDEYRLTRMNVSSSYYEVYGYNSKNELTNVKTYNFNNILEGKESRIYNEKGLIINEFVYDEDGYVKFNQTFEYDDFGNIILNKWYDRNSELEDLYKYEYNQEGRVIKEVSERRQFGNRTITYEYEDCEKGFWNKKFTIENGVTKYCFVKIIKG